MFTIFDIQEAGYQRKKLRYGMEVMKLITSNLGTIRHTEVLQPKKKAYPLTVAIKNPLYIFVILAIQEAGYQRKINIF